MSAAAVVAAQKARGPRRLQVLTAMTLLTADLMKIEICWPSYTDTMKRPYDQEIDR